MRVAREFAAGGTRGRPAYFAPERPRVADPGRRLRIADYLSGGTTVGSVLHTDGLWLWPERFVAQILDDGLAPEPDFLEHMRRQEFRAPAPKPDARLAEAASIAWRAGPPSEPPVLIAYFVRVDDDSSEEAPLSLLRRVRTPSGRLSDEALWRDLAWHPTQAFAAHSLEYDLREVTPAHAAGVLDRWCEKWHQEEISRASR